MNHSWFPKIGLPPVLIQILVGFSLTKTIQLLGYLHFGKLPYTIIIHNLTMVISLWFLQRWTGDTWKTPRRLWTRAPAVLAGPSVPWRPLLRAHRLMMRWWTFQYDHGYGWHDPWRIRMYAKQMVCHWPSTKTPVLLAYIYIYHTWILWVMVINV